MVLNFVDKYDDKEFEADFSEIDRIWEFESSDGSAYCEFSYADDPIQRDVAGSLDEVISGIYRRGYQSGYQTAKNEEKLSGENTEDVPDTNATKNTTPELKGYITDVNGERLNINHIVSFGEDGGRTHAWGDDSGRYLFNMSAKDFEKMLVQKQEELR